MNYAKYYLGRESEYQLLTKDAVCMGHNTDCKYSQESVCAPSLWESACVCACVSAIFILSLLFTVHNCIISAVSGLWLCKHYCTYTVSMGKTEMQFASTASLASCCSDKAQEARALYWLILPSTDWSTRCNYSPSLLPLVFCAPSNKRMFSPPQTRHEPTLMN